MRSGGRGCEGEDALVGELEEARGGVECNDVASMASGARDARECTGGSDRTRERCESRTQVRGRVKDRLDKIDFMEKNKKWNVDNLSLRPPIEPSCQVKAVRRRT